MTHDDPKADNLLIRLFSYTPRLGRLPEEDFCTECLAWMLRNVAEFQARFLKLAGVTTDCRQWRIMTQDPSTEAHEVDEGSRFDLVLDPSQRDVPVLVIECKVRAGITDDQIRKYRRKAEVKWLNRPIKIILLTKDSRATSG